MMLRRRDRQKRALAGALTLLLAACGGGVLILAQQGAQDLPRFTSSVEVTTIDVNVFDERGQPITDLTPEDFTVRVDGDTRRVVTADWVPLESGTSPPTLPLPEGYSGNSGETGGRLILLLIDQPNIRVGGTMAIRRALEGFIDKLEPSDRAAVVSLGFGALSTPFTSDRARLKQAAALMNGQFVAANNSFYSYQMSTTEAVDIDSGNSGVLLMVAFRECGGLTPECQWELESIARDLARPAAMGAQETLLSFRRLLLNLRAIEAPKTVILISEGFLTDDVAAVQQLGTLAAAARTSIYALRLDSSFLSSAAESSRAPFALGRMSDSVERSRGLEVLASASRGTIINVVGDGAGAFARVSAELAGYYLLGVEAGDRDRDGKLHPIKVEVTRRGARVRTRPGVAASVEPPSPLVNPRQAVAAALASPLPVSALPLRIATFSLQGPDPQKIQLLIHADIGTDYATSRAVSLAYTIVDSTGRTVEIQAATARVPPIMSGVPSPLQFTAGASLPPGEYTLKLAAAEGERVGTVEHTFRASVGEAGPVTVSDLMVGGPFATRIAAMSPSVGHTVAFGAVHGYLEAYGADARTLNATYEVAPDREGEAILSETVEPTLAGAGQSRAIFTHVMVVRQLPPGPYWLRVRLASRAEPIATRLRAFEIAAPAVLMTSASSGGDALPRDLFLPVPDAMTSKPFDRAAATGDAALRAFRDRVPDAARATFEEAVGHLGKGEFPAAEKLFKSIINPEADSTAAIAYVAATFAASGADLQAAGAWQTALVDGSEIPEIYEWLVGALLRLRDHSQARGVLDEATGKWPGDVRFARPMAIVYAALGQGAEAVRTLERHLGAHGDDLDALMLGVEWIFQLRQSGASAHSPAEDARLARRYADAYLKAQGPQAALVRQWMQAIEGRRR